MEKGLGIRYQVSGSRKDSRAKTVQLLDSPANRIGEGCFVLVMKKGFRCRGSGVRERSLIKRDTTSMLRRIADINQLELRVASHTSNDYWATING